MIGQLKNGQETEERERMTCSKGPQGGIEPVATAARTRPLCMGRLLFRLTYRAPQLCALIYVENKMEENTKYKQV